MAVAVAELPLPPAQAVALVADPEQAPRWMTSLVSLRWGHLPPQALDRPFVVERQLADRTARWPAQVTAWEPPALLGWRILQDQLTVERTIRIQATATGSRVELEEALTAATGVARLALPWFRREVRRRLAADAAALAALARGAAP